MASLNQVTICGNLTRDVELRFTANQKAVCDLGVAVNEKIKNASGEYVDAPVFLDVTCWGRTAEIAGEYLSKGSPVLITGRLALDSWQTPEGQKRTKLKVVCERMQMLGTKGDRTSQAGRSVDEYSQDGPPASAPARDDEDTPF